MGYNPSKFNGKQILAALIIILSAAAMLVTLGAGAVDADPVSSEQGSQTQPSNGSAVSLNLTFGAQQYIGFFGNVTMTVRTAAGGNYLANKTIRNGTIYIISSGSVPNWGTLNVSANDGYADGNYSLTGAYITSNVFNLKNNICGLTQVYSVNTSDNFPVGILRDGNSSTSKHIICTPIRDTITTKGFGWVQYEIIAPKTATWGPSGYTLYVEAGSNG